MNVSTAKLKELPTREEYKEVKNNTHKSSSNTDHRSPKLKDNAADVSNNGSTMANNLMQHRHQDITLGNELGNTGEVPSNKTRDDLVINGHEYESRANNHTAFPNGLNSLPPPLPPRSAARNLGKVTNI